LIIIDDPDRLINLKEEDPFGYTPEGQAHCLITGLIAIAGIDSAALDPKSRFIWSRADYEAVSAQINTHDWKLLFNDRPVNDNYELLVAKYKEAVKAHIPTISKPFVPVKELWITSKVLSAVEEKRELWAKYLAAGRHTHEVIREQHREACKKVVKVVGVAMLNYELQSRTRNGCTHTSRANRKSEI
jgi:hypothetical protein